MRGMASTVTACTCGASGIFARERLARPLFGAHAAGMDAHVEAKEEERVGTVIVQVSLNVAADAYQDRGDENHRCNADHDAQHGQERARLVVAHRIQGHPRIYAKVHHKKQLSVASCQWSVVSCQFGYPVLALLLGQGGYAT